MKPAMETAAMVDVNAHGYTVKGQNPYKQTASNPD